MKKKHYALPAPTYPASELIAYDGADLTQFEYVSSDPVVLDDLYQRYLSIGQDASYLSNLSPGQLKKAIAKFEQSFGEQLSGTISENVILGGDSILSADAGTDATAQPNVASDPSSISTEGDPIKITLEAGIKPIELDSTVLVTDVPNTSEIPQDRMIEFPSDEPVSLEDVASGDFYVAVDGNDNAMGTIDDPFASIEKAVSAAGTGDLILVRDGTYKGQVNIWNGGELGAELKIKAYPGEHPVIDGSGTPLGTDLVVISASNVVFDGFEVKNSQRSGITVWSSENVTISDNIVHTTQQSGIWIGSDKLGISSGHLIEGNAVFDTGLSNQDLAASQGWPRAIGVDVSSDTIVRDNHVFENYGEGIGALSSTKIEISKNFVYDNYSVQIYLDNVQDVTASDNFIFHTFEEEFYRDGEPGIGILIANENTQYEMATSGLLIQGNTYAGVESAFYDGSYGWGGGMTDSTIGNEYIASGGDYSSDWLWA